MSLSKPGKQHGYHMLVGIRKSAARAKDLEYRRISFFMNLNMKTNLIFVRPILIGVVLALSLAATKTAFSQAATRPTASPQPADVTRPTRRPIPPPQYI